MPDKVGFVGLGTMGGPMCLNLVMKGCETTVYDVVDGAADPHLEAGARQGQGHPKKPKAAQGLTSQCLPRAPIPRWIPCNA